MYDLFVICGYCLILFWDIVVVVLVSYFGLLGYFVLKDDLFVEVVVEFEVENEMVFSVIVVVLELGELVFVVFVVCNVCIEGYFELFVVFIGEVLVFGYFVYDWMCECYCWLWVLSVDVL